MDFDELDELEERQRWALNEIKKTQAQQLQRAAQEQYKQWTKALATRPKEVPEAIDSDNTSVDTSAPVGLAGFAAPVWRMQPTPTPAPPEITPSVPSRPRPRGFAKFQEMRRDTPKAAEAAPASSLEADPMQAFAQRLMVHAQEERQLQRSWEQLQSGECGLPVMTSTQDDDLDQEVPALNALIAILDEEEKEEQEFEQLKPYLPELGTKATSSLVPAGKDGSNPFVTQAVEVVQRFYPDVDLSSAFGDHYKEVLRAAAHRSARGGHIEQVQLRNVQRAEEERRAQEERRKEPRQRRYLIQERQRALGSLGDTKISTKVRASMPEAIHAAGASLGGAPNGLLFPDMDGSSFASFASAGDEAETAPAVCFPRTTAASETLPAKAKTKPLGLLASLKLAEDEDDDRLTLEELTGLPSKAKSEGYSRRPDAGRAGRAEREEAERQLRAAEQQQRLERLKERRLQRDKAKALEAPLGKVMSWGPASEIPRVKR